MDNIIKQEQNSLMGLLHGQSGMEIPMPYERDILLFDSYVAGISHVDGIEELEPFLKIGDRLDFFREPNNPYEKHGWYQNWLCSQKRQCCFFQTHGCRKAVIWTDFKKGI